MARGYVCVSVSAKHLQYALLQLERARAEDGCCRQLTTGPPNASLPALPSRGERMENGEGTGHREQAQRDNDDDGFTTVPVKHSSGSQTASRGRKNRKGKNAAPAPKNLVTLVEERVQELRRDGYPQRCLGTLRPKH